MAMGWIRCGCRALRGVRARCVRCECMRAFSDGVKPCATGFIKSGVCGFLIALLKPAVSNADTFVQFAAKASKTKWRISEQA